MSFAFTESGAEGARPGAQPLPGQGTAGAVTSQSALANSAQLFKAEGNAAFKAGDYADALRSYSEAIGVLNQAAAAAPGDDAMLVLLHSNGSEALYRLGQMEAALEWAEAAVAIDPSHKKSVARQAKAQKALKAMVPELLRDPSENQDVAAASAPVAKPEPRAYAVRLSAPDDGVEADGRWSLKLIKNPKTGRGLVEDVEEEEEMARKQAWRSIPVHPSVRLRICSIMLTWFV
jgi:tetratricopeptide (TPR) repeat protein